MSSTVRWTGSCCSFFGVAIPARRIAGDQAAAQQEAEEALRRGQLAAHRALAIAPQQIGQESAQRQVIDAHRQHLAAVVVEPEAVRRAGSACSCRRSLM